MDYGAGRGVQCVSVADDTAAVWSPPEGQKLPEMHACERVSDIQQIPAVRLQLSIWSGPTSPRQKGCELRRQMANRNSHPRCPLLAYVAAENPSSRNCRQAWAAQPLRDQHPGLRRNFNGCAVIER